MSKHQKSIYGHIHNFDPIEDYVGVAIYSRGVLSGTRAILGAENGF